MTIIKNLKHHIEDVRMRFFNFIKENHAVWSAAYFFRQLTTFVIPNIAWWRTNHLAGRMLFHIFTHVHANHGVLVVKHKLSQGFRKFCFTHTGWPHKNKGTNRAFIVCYTCTRATNGTCHGVNCFLLSDYSFL